MTFSIIGRCARKGMFGVAITTSSIAVGARCPHARAGVGAVDTQNVTDPSLGPELLDLMGQGKSARAAMDQVVHGRRDIEYRQLTAIDRSGGLAHWTGAKVLGRNAVAEGVDCLAAGNLLKSEGLPAAMVTKFGHLAETHLAERLLQALLAGLEHGGEEGPVHSAALLVYDKLSFPLVSLRVDWDDENPIARLGLLWKDYEGQLDAYLQRAVNPSGAQSYGVPGDP